MSILLGLLFVSTNAFAWGARTTPKAYCGDVKDKEAKAVCEATYDRLKSHLTKEHMVICSAMLDMLEKLQDKKWNHAAGCLELLAGRESKSFLQGQVEFCTDFMKSSQSTTDFLICIQEQDSEMFELCKYPLQAGQYRVTSECLTAIQGVASKKIELQKLRDECNVGAVKTVEKKKLSLVSWAPLPKCMNEFFERHGVSSTPGRVDPTTGSVEKSNR